MDGWMDGLAWRVADNVRQSYWSGESRQGPTDCFYLVHGSHDRAELL